MIREIKMIISVKLLFWSFSIMPDCKFKIKLAMLLNDNIINDFD